MKSLYVLITGFGTPHYEHKINILRNNLEKIHQYPWKQVEITIYQYSDPSQYVIPQELFERYNLKIIYQPGIVGEFMKLGANPEHIHKYDYILTLLDDVELVNPEWNKLMEYIEEFQFDLLSPCLTRDSKYQYEYMRYDEKLPIGLKVTPCCEYFCFFADTQRFHRYWLALEDKNPWMWGLDLILRKHLNLRVAIVTWFQMKHWYKNESYRPDLANPVEGFKFMMDKYQDTADALANQCPIMYYIVDPFHHKK